MIRWLTPLALLATTASAQGLENGPVKQVPAFRLPPSNQLSSAAREVLARMDAAAAPQTVKDDLAKQRAFYGEWNDDRLVEMRRRFQTVVRHETIGGVSVDIVDPTLGTAPGNVARVLINVHGGAFMWGAGSGALVEAIPVAATMRIRVVTVDYRLAPEHHYPAASEDVRPPEALSSREHRYLWLFGWRRHYRAGDCVDRPAGPPPPRSDRHLLRYWRALQRRQPLCGASGFRQCPAWHSRAARDSPGQLHGRRASHRPACLPTRI